MEDGIKARHISDEEMQVAFAKSNLSGRARTWALDLQLHDPNVFESLAVFKTLLSQTFERPRAEFRTLTEILKIKKVSVTSTLTFSTFVTLQVTW